MRGLFLEYGDIGKSELQKSLPHEFFIREIARKSKMHLAPGEKEAIVKPESQE